MHSEHCQTSKTKLFAKIIKGRRLLIVFTKNFILDVLQEFEYASA